MHKSFSRKLMLLLPLLLLLITSCGEAKPISRTGLYFDTVITLTVYDEKDLPALKESFSLADRYEKLFSTAVPGSDVCRINDAAGKTVTVDPETMTLLLLAKEYAALSGGAFDPTIGALTSLWDFRSEAPSVPSESEIKAALSTVDYRNLILDEKTSSVSLSGEGAKLDLGGIAKGYIADRMKEKLLSRGVENAIINLGGNVLTLGSKPDGSGYRVGIQYPFRDDGTPIGSLSVSGQSLVSSGVYERYFEKDGTLYHHILDTKTGYPVRNNLFGVTILSESSVRGDALSTICFCLGLSEGMKLIESLPDTEAVFITEDDQLHPSSGFPEISPP